MPACAAQVHFGYHQNKVSPVHTSTLRSILCPQQQHEAFTLYPFMQSSHLRLHCDDLLSACKAPPSWAESLQTLHMAATWQSATSWQRLTTTLAWLIQIQYTNRWVLVTGGRVASAAKHTSGIVYAMRKRQRNSLACETVDDGRRPIAEKWFMVVPPSALYVLRLMHKWHKSGAD